MNYQSFLTLVKQWLESVIADKILAGEHLDGIPVKVFTQISRKNPNTPTPSFNIAAELAADMNQVWAEKQALDPKLKPFKMVFSQNGGFLMVQYYRL